MSADDPFCPRHGRASRPSETPGLRCDCPPILLAGVSPLRSGKWVSGALRPYGEDGVFAAIRDEVEARARRAVEEALRAGYELGLAGGVPAAKVATCAKCRTPFLTPTFGRADDTCTSCWSAENP